MTTLFKRRGRDVWYGKYKDHTGKWVRVSLSNDKGVSQGMLAELQKKHDLIKAEVLPVSVLNVDSRPLRDQLEDFLQGMRDENRNPVHIKTTEARIRAALDAIGPDIEAAPLTRWLAKCRKDGMSVSTSNGYLTAVKSFMKWLVRSRRRPVDPLAGVRKLNAETARRRVRRVLTDDELTRFLDAAPEDRRWLYLLAVTTGLRASELASLTPESFHLSGDQPTLVLRAGYSKSKKMAVQPLRTELVEPLRAWLAGRAPGAPLWGGTWARDKHGGEWVKRDLERAGLPFKDEQGRQFDFHSLRYQFVTAMSRVCSLVMVQKLARHSDPNLTANIYTQLGILEKHEAINRAAMPGARVQGDQTGHQTPVQK